MKYITFYVGFNYLRKNGFFLVFCKKTDILYMEFQKSMRGFYEKMIVKYVYFIMMKIIIQKCKDIRRRVVYIINLIVAQNLPINMQ